MKEYEMLRAEMMDDYKTISQYNVVLYTATATILAFAIKDGTFLSCLIPYCVLLPLYLICEAKRRVICRIAAYLNVYYEGTEYNWERRHHVFDETVEKNKKKRFFRSSSSPLPYYCIAIVCSIASLIKIPYDSQCWYLSVIEVACVVALTVIAILIMNANKTDYTDARNQYIKEWRAQKEAEETQKEAEEAQKAAEEAQKTAESGRT